MHKNSPMLYAILVAVAVAVIALFVIGLVDRLQDPVSTQPVDVQPG
jgi:hypothetical protein